MKHALIKFNYGVEIGARLAYLGHYEATKDTNILGIAADELRHRMDLREILEDLGEKPFWGFNTFFTCVGTVIGKLCTLAPRRSLNLVARTMEMFAIFNYAKLAKKYPQYRGMFLEMAATEKEHEEYFTNVNV